MVFDFLYNTYKLLMCMLRCTGEEPGTNSIDELQKIPVTDKLLAG
jgi:hypothetical protein